MKKIKLAFLLFGALLVVSGGFWYIQDAREQQHFILLSERKRVKKSNFDKPNEFYRYFREIRSKIGGKSKYKGNYRFEELQKAKVASAKKSTKSIDWVERGPGNVGGRTRSLILDPSDPQKIWYAGSVSGGIWKTTNAGRSWTDLTSDFPNLAITSLAMSESEPNIMYAGTGEGFSISGGVRGDGLFRSTDRGESWTQIKSTTGSEDFAYVNEIRVDPTNPDVLLVATKTGVFKSSTAGAEWKKVLSSFGGKIDLDYPTNVQSLVTSEDFKVLFAGANRVGVFRSVDAGESWEFVLPAGESDGRVGLAIAPGNAKKVYAVIVRGLVPENSSAVYYSSSNQGDTWFRVVVGENENDNFLGDQGWYDLATVVNPYDENELFVGGVYMGKLNITDEEIQIRDITKVTDDKTANFIEYINFGALNWNGMLENSTVSNGDGSQISEKDLRTIEIRFGKGITQKAHRFIVAENEGPNSDGGAGIGYNKYMFKDYIDVPFQVWDTEKNVQLMVSFRDNERDGKFNLIPRDENQDNRAREYMLIHSVEYSETMDGWIAMNGGVTYKLMYFLWPTLKFGKDWDENNLASSKLKIETREMAAKVATPTLLSDSRNGGPNKNLHADHHIFKTIKLNNETKSFTIVNGNDGGLGISTDNGAKWQQIPDADHQGYNTTQFYGVDKCPGENKYLGGMQDNGTWLSAENPDKLSKFSFEIGGDGFEVLWHARNPQKMIGGAYNNRFAWTEDGGESWFAVSKQIHDGPFVSRLAGSDIRPDLVFAVGKKGVWRSVDFGKRWNSVPINSAWTGLFSSVVRISLAHHDYVWTGGAMNGTEDMIHLSTNGGVTFTPVNNFSDKEGSTISNIATHPFSKKTAYVLFSQRGEAKVIRTEDAGQSWTDLTKFIEGKSQNGFPDVAVYSLFVFPNEPNRIWVGTEIGLVESTDNGETWNMPDNGFPNVSVWQMKSRDNQLIVATHGRGIWTADIENLSVSTDIIAYEDKIKLYPNPAVDRINLSLKSKKMKGKVRLSVIDISGKIVHHQEINKNGVELSTEVNVNHLNTGQYILRIQNGEVLRTKMFQVKR